MARYPAVPMARKKLAFELHQLGWDLRRLAKYFRRSRQAISNWIQDYEGTQK